ncbi:MAG: hypothetical protein ABL962_21420, partial [Fimbriimonadaceae bacterium]
MNFRTLPVLLVLVLSVGITLMPSDSFAQKRTIDIVWVGGFTLSEEAATTPELQVLRAQIAASAELKDYHVVVHNYTWRGTS